MKNKFKGSYFKLTILYNKKILLLKLLENSAQIMGKKTQYKSGLKWKWLNVRVLQNLLLRPVTNAGGRGFKLYQPNL